MKISLLSLVMVSAALSAAAGLFPTPRPTPLDPPGQAKLYLVSGEVTVKHADERTATATRGATLGEGTTVITGAGAAAMLVFSNGTAVQLKSGTELRIEQFRQAPYDAAQQGTFLRLAADPSKSALFLKVVRGAITGEVKPLNTAAGSTFRVELPDGSVRASLQ